MDVWPFKGRYFYDVRMIFCRPHVTYGIHASSFRLSAFWGPHLPPTHCGRHISMQPKRHISMQPKLPTEFRETTDPRLRDLASKPSQVAGARSRNLGPILLLDNKGQRRPGGGILQHKVAVLMVFRNCLWMIGPSRFKELRIDSKSQFWSDFELKIDSKN